MFGLLGAIIGILLLLWAVFMLFFFPAITEHQTEHFGKNGIIFGFFLVLVGALLVFF